MAARVPSPSSRTTVTRLGAALLIGVVAGCAGPPPEMPASSGGGGGGAGAAAAPSVAAEAPATDRAAGIAAPLSRQQAEEVFSYGYHAMADRYIDPVDLREIGLSGLQGLRTLDPRVTITHTGQVLEIRHGGRIVGAFPLPGPGDDARWGVVTTAILALLQEVSPAIARAEPEALYEAVFTAALDRLDPFSRYAGRDAASVNRGARNGFGGIGIVYDVDADGVRITRVMAGTPAADAGLRVGDRILAVDGVSTRGMDREAVRAHLRGPTNSPVTVLIAGADALDRRRVTMARALIVMPTVDLHLEDGVAYLAISSFNQRTTTAVAEAISAARSRLGEGLVGVVLDLRGNPGGLLEQAVTLSDLFLDSGSIVSTRGRHPDARQFYSATSGDLVRGSRLAVLIDGDSASAAEIVAAALQDNGRAVVVGTTSYGKGTVQTVVQLPNGGEITLTWSRFHSPSGYVLHGLGVFPVACTSGIGGPADQGATAVVTQVARHTAETATTMTLWRATDDRDSLRRLTLREACPAETHPDAAIDKQVAGRLLADDPLFRRLLGLSAPAQAAMGRR